MRQGQWKQKCNGQHYDTLDDPDKRSKSPEAGRAKVELKRKPRGRGSKEGKKKGRHEEEKRTKDLQVRRKSGSDMMQNTSL